MCHFIWQDNPCCECGVLFDRRLTCCQRVGERRITRTRLAGGTSRAGSAEAAAVPCDARYAMLADPAFKCQECKLIEMEPWLPVQKLWDMERRRRGADENGEAHADDEDHIEYEDKNDPDWEPDSDEDEEN